MNRKFQLAERERNYPAGACVIRRLFRHFVIIIVRMKMWRARQREEREREAFIRLAL